MISTEVKFLGYEISDEKLGLHNYIQKKKEMLWEVKKVKDLERVIDIISYVRKIIKGMEIVLAKFR